MNTAMGIVTTTAAIKIDHEWNAEEDRHFHEYLKEKHRKDHDWQHASKREQQDYRKWRHEH